MCSNIGSHLEHALEASPEVAVEAKVNSLIYFVKDFYSSYSSKSCRRFCGAVFRKQIYTWISISPNVLLK